MRRRFVLDPTGSKEIEAKNQKVETEERFPTSAVPLFVGMSAYDVDLEAIAWGFHGVKKFQSIINAR